jgi:hypothetical protein
LALPSIVVITTQIPLIQLVSQVLEAIH